MFQHQGFSLIEVLVSLAIVSFALFSLAKLQMMSLSYQYESTLIAQAANFVSDVSLSQLYNDENIAALNHRAQKTFPSGVLTIQGGSNAIGLNLRWKVPRLTLYQLNFYLMGNTNLD